MRERGCAATWSPASRWRPIWCPPDWATRRSPTSRRRRDSTPACSADWSSGCSAVRATRRSRSPRPFRSSSAHRSARSTGGDPTRFGALAAATALLVALIAFLAWLVRAGAIVNFISESVMVGFKCGVALFLASTQLPKLFGIHGAHGDFWENAGISSAHLGETNLTSLAVGGVALRLLVLGKIFLEEQAGVAVRGGRWHRRVGLARPRRARGEAPRRRARRACRRSACRRSAGPT